MNRIATDCPINFLYAVIGCRSSFNPMKKIINMAAMMYFNSCAVVIPVKSTDEIITPANIATPPRFGVGLI